MVRKVGFFILSLSILFVLILVLTIDHLPIYFGDDWEFIGIGQLLIQNYIQILCVLMLLVAVASYCDFRFRGEGTRELSFTIVEVEKVDSESLTFLTTYILPLVCLDFDDPKYRFLFVVILILIGCIYVRTDLFYTNPTLALLNFRIYKVDGLFIRNRHKKNIILISRDKLTTGDSVQYIKLDERIYYSFKK